MAIGWHFYYEASQKIKSQETDRPFSAEAYLRSSTGPLAPYFRSMLPDPDSRETLDPEQITSAWNTELDRFIEHYQFSDAQKAQARELLKSQESTALVWFEDPETAQKLREYFEDAEAVYGGASDSPALAYEEELRTKKKGELEVSRKQFVTTVSGWSDDLRSKWVGLAEPDQLASAGEYRPAWTKLDTLNALVMYGMLAVGLCLMLGLLTPLAALGGATFLAMFYLSMPPWPGLPLGPQAEGNYLYVNKNLIEMLACLALAATPSGLWVGLDAVLFGWIGRRRPREQAEDVDAPSAVGTF